LVVAALLWVVYVVLARILLEAFAVLFRIHDDTSRVADALAGSRPPTGTGSGAGVVVDPDPGYGATQAYPAPGYGTTPPPAPPGGRPGAPPADPSSPPWT
ncbi:MAG TPA: hypothetical protein VEV65_01165, partial [Kineosporiaceae bacterium]|nr:hypothetical protein [Kineosporiaceae bacterium]